MDGLVLAVQPGLLARYQQLAVVEEIRDRAGATNGPHSFWLLLPAEEIEEAPVLNGEAIPVLASFQWARIPRAWVENRHRSVDEPSDVVELGAAG